MHLEPVPLEHLVNAAADFARWLGPVASRPGCDFSLQDLAGIVERQEGQLIALVDDDGEPAGLGVTQVRDHESGHRSCWVLALGGERVASWASTMSIIEAGARAKGCDRIEFVGRRGWKRLLRDFVAEPDAAGCHYSKTLGH